MATPPKDRRWEIDGNPLVAETEEELHSAVAEAAQILNRIGGAITVVADRSEISPGHYVTTRFIFKWSSFVPAKRQEPVSEAKGAPDA